MIAVAVVIMFTASDADAADVSDKAPEFLFSDDNQILQTRDLLPSSIEQKPILRDDAWLNAPLTRLDYVLINIQSHLNAELPGIAASTIQEYFERTDLLIYPKVEFEAKYLEKWGRLFIMATVDYVGKPKKPMKEFCGTLLKYTEREYPLEPSYSLLWNRRALGLLMRDDENKYRETAETLMEAAVILVNVNAVYDVNDKRAFYYLGCMRQDATGPIKYYKSSSSTQ